jgi:hypothetical protein
MHSKIVWRHTRTISSSMIPSINEASADDNV